jgi:hypothetical protein
MVSGIAVVTGTRAVSASPGGRPWAAGSPAPAGQIDIGDAGPETTALQWPTGTAMPRIGRV